jgi:F0F1-type ATP synthase membrane subunit b/b'
MMMHGREARFSEDVLIAKEDTQTADEYKGELTQDLADAYQRARKELEMARAKQERNYNEKRREVEG